MISVIVPVYNVEKYLDKCVQSILEQTYKDFELILVDDCSTDNSGKMCDEYAQKDKRVRVIHKPNGGLSDARNCGTEAAIGSYVTYIDSDDYVSEDYLQTLNDLSEKHKAEIVVTGILKFYDDKYPIIKKIKNGEIVFSGVEALKNILYQKGMDTSACALLIKRIIADDHPFPLGKYHEDDFTTYKYYLDANVVVHSAKKQYYYRQRKGSIMYSFGQAHIDEIEAADNLVKSLETKSRELGRAARAKKFSDYCQVYIHSDKNMRNQLRTIENYIIEEKLEILKDKNTRYKNKVAAIALYIGPSFMCFLFNIWQHIIQ